MYLSERDDIIFPHSVSMGILRPRSRHRLVRAMDPSLTRCGIMGSVVLHHVLPLQLLFKSNAQQVDLKSTHLHYKDIFSFICAAHGHKKRFTERERERQR